jgi:hypothetical protein
MKMFPHNWNTPINGHRHFHVIHTQVVVDNTGKICHIQSGFLGHQNDAQHFRLMPQIGYNQELDFPQNFIFFLHYQVLH